MYVCEHVHTQWERVLESWIRGQDFGILAQRLGN